MPLTSRTKKTEPTLYRLNTVLSFGKYRGCTVDDILEDHPQYLEWCLENVEGFDLHAEVTDDPRWIEYQFPLDGDEDDNYNEGPWGLGYDL